MSNTLEMEKYMRRAAMLAQRGCGYTSPNPLVGAVIVKNGRIIGEGWHEKYGGPHAERTALSSCTESPEGAEMYVTLEPCCHHGKQPPCTEAIIDAKIAKVFVGSPDPNPLVSGKGIEALRKNGIEVTENILRDECDSINEIFFHYITTGKPFVIMKYAMTMDGKIAAYTGKSRWITESEARQHAHRLRQKCSAIMVGVGTVIADDPLLTCRIEGGRNPLRIVCDSSLRTPVDSAIVKTAKDVPTLIATCCEKTEKIRPYEDAGCRIIRAASEDGKVDLKYLMDELGKSGIDSVLIEGGGELNWSALKSGVVSKVNAYIAPKILGGDSAKSPVGGMGVSSPDRAFLLKCSRIQKIGEDFLIESEVSYRCSQE